MLDATFETSNIGRFANHAVGHKENCCITILKDDGGRYHLILKATKKIQADAELFWNYGVKNLFF